MLNRCPRDISDLFTKKLEEFGIYHCHPVEFIKRIDNGDYDVINYSEEFVFTITKELHDKLKEELNEDSNNIKGIFDVFDKVESPLSKISKNN